MGKKLCFPPLGRVLVIYIAGILFHNTATFLCAVFFVFVISFSAGWIFLAVRWRKSFYGNFVFGLVIYSFFICAGYLSASEAFSESEWKESPAEREYLVKITEEAEIKPKTFKYIAEIKSAVYGRGKRVILYIPKTPKPFEAGSFLLVETSFISPPESRIGEHFEYSSYLRHRGIAAVGYIAKGKWQEKGEASVWDLKSLSLHLRRYLMDVLEKNFPDRNHSSLAEALLLGYEGNIDRSVKEAFSSVGVAHVLSVSGLHVGLVYLIVNFFLGFIKNPRAIFLKPFISSSFIWFYALLTGLSSPVVRSAFMICFGLFAKLLNKPHYVLHSVLCSALLMLLYSPYYLYDVGFELSYASLVSILLFYPLMLKLYRGEGRITLYLWKVFALSFSAQLGALPLSLYYFGNIPVLFFLSNLLIVPQTSVLMLFSAFSLVCPFPQMTASCIDPPGNALMDLYLDTVKTLESVPFGNIEGIIGTERLEIAEIYLLLFFLYLFIRYKNKKNAYITVALAVYLLIYYL